MSLYSEKPTDSLAVFDRAVRYLWVSLKNSIIFILLLALSQYISIYGGNISSYVWLNTTLDILGIILFLFFAGAMLLQVNTGLLQAPPDWRDSIKLMWPQCLRFFVMVVMLILIVGLYYYLIAWIMQTWLGAGADHVSLKRSIFLVVVGIVPILVFLVFMVLTLPLILLENLNPWAAMRRSRGLIDARWLQAFTLYASMGVFYILISSTTLHAHFFMRYHVFWLFIFIIDCIMLPFVFNYALFLLHDFKLRQKLALDLD